jgi:hypothetical protein
VKSFGPLSPGNKFLFSVLVAQTQVAQQNFAADTESQEPVSAGI